MPEAVAFFGTRRRNDAAKRWSDLHGDMQSQAEMTWLPSDPLGGNRSVGPYPSWA